ncbi:MAG: hypothetical protein ACFFD4_23750 [Candidatus Odinarchaeota archaeon]
MTSENRLKNKIKGDIDKLSPEDLQEVQDFISNILIKEKPAKRTIKMKGIWEGLGFEKIADLEGNTRKMRTETGKQVLEKLGR